MLDHQVYYCCIFFLHFIFRQKSEGLQSWEIYVNFLEKKHNNGQITKQ